MSRSDPSGDCATKLAVLADPTRLSVMEILLAGPQNVKAINRRVPIAQNLLSHHLRVLRDAGLVVADRDGKAVRYALAEGVALQAAGGGINLGCCNLQFTKIETGAR
ncbi:MAG: metalloregulator ArsR/SmtB family transcription factor [Acidobacteria bacterium]|nr:metalloregulator ArsR/SmtB family transcription factor [Acidobacteriota bacterium]